MHIVRATLAVKTHRTIEKGVAEYLVGERIVTDRRIVVRVNNNRDICEDIKWNTAAE
jgi:hypothetical protein